ncbi:hypothetical protein [Alkalihalophilus marmarensis]|uniref:hypothetical protein n=1 Tax=Alkalihalophilus marmarensis TaxID=521377 RepID=UPI002DBD9C9D|nr:hypothetical protein [Alkalihalophilus marmarensis]MEC2074420.1 hypothetical protein [Alkalihalophilus marmarensis]
MSQIARFVPRSELKKHEGKFTSSSFLKLMNDLRLSNLGEPVSDIVKVMISPNDNEKDLKNYTLTETNKLLKFGNKAQVILKHYEVQQGKESEIIEVAQAWIASEEGTVFKEYVAGQLSIETTTDEMHDVYNDYIKIPEIGEEHEELLVEIMYDPLSCIRSGSCCIFENQRYEHCGKTCGIYESAGGGTAINSYDSCCRTHDIQIRGKTGKDRCTPHKNFMSCTKGLKAPGDTTMRNGIRADALANGCGII